DVSSRIETDVAQAQAVIDTLPAVGISLDDVMDELLTEGIDKFIKPFDKLMDSLVTKVKQLSPA
ncbi:MAG: transaldolase, partial [Cyanobacteria bacterium P01_D01_bin.2]